MSSIRFEIDPHMDGQLRELWTAVWGTPADPSLDNILARSLAYVGTYDGPKLVGFVNVGWDGGLHAFILDTSVHPNYRRQGIGTRLVTNAAQVARQRGARWLHVDFEPHLREFYRQCGFGYTDAGLMIL